MLPSKAVVTDAFIASKRILTGNSIIDAWVVEALVDICTNNGNRI